MRTDSEGKPTMNEPLLLDHQGPVLVPLLMKGLLQKETQLNEKKNLIFVV